jgi:hypothetical protein
LTELKIGACCQYPIRQPLSNNLDIDRHRDYARQLECLEASISHRRYSNYLQFAIGIHLTELSSRIADPPRTGNWCGCTIRWYLRAA